MLFFAINPNDRCQTTTVAHLNLHQAFALLSFFDVVLKCFGNNIISVAYAVIVKLYFVYALPL